MNNQKECRRLLYKLFKCGNYHKNQPVQTCVFHISHLNFKMAAIFELFKTIIETNVTHFHDLYELYVTYVFYFANHVHATSNQ